MLKSPPMINEPDFAATRPSANDTLQSCRDSDWTLYCGKVKHNMMVSTSIANILKTESKKYGDDSSS